MPISGKTRFLAVNQYRVPPTMGTLHASPVLLNGVSTVSVAGGVSVTTEVALWKRRVSHWSWGSAHFPEFGMAKRQFSVCHRNRPFHTFRPRLKFVVRWVPLCNVWRARSMANASSSASFVLNRHGNILGEFADGEWGDATPLLFDLQKTD